MVKRKPRRSREFKKNSQIIDFDEAREARRKKRGSLSSKKAESDELTTAQKNASQRKNAMKNRRKLASAIILLFVIVVIAFSTFNIVSLRAQKKELQEINKDLLSKKQKLTEELNNTNSPEYIEQQARIQLKLIKPGELLYILPETNSTTPAGVITPDGNDSTFDDGDSGAKGESLEKNGQAETE